MSSLIDGKKHAADWLEEYKDEIVGSKLVIVIAGNNPASLQYVTMKKRKGEELGVKVVVEHFPETAQVQEIVRTIQEYNEDSETTGIMVQLPLPLQLESYHREILDSISASKDVDCLTTHRIGRILTDTQPLLPATVAGVQRLLKQEEIDVQGKIVTILGASLIVGTPLALYLQAKNATVTVCNKYTPDTAIFTSKADIVISAVGRPHLIQEKDIKPNAIVIDIGISSQNGKTVGDVEFSSVSQVAAKITPVPGGVGPMTVAALFANLAQLKESN